MTEAEAALNFFALFDMKCSNQLTSSHPKLVLSPKLSALTSDAYILIPGNENQDIGIYL